MLTNNLERKGIKVTSKKKRVYKKSTALALAVMLGTTIVPIAGTHTAFAAEANQSAYDSVFRIPSNQVQSHTSNGGSYWGSKLDYMFDDNKNTHWETNTQNSTSFENHVVVTFKDEVTLGSVVIHPRVAGALNKGFPKSFSIYASTQDKGEDFELVHQGSAAVMSGDLKIEFKTPTKFKRLKFEFDAAHENWAAIAEMKFYKEDATSKKIAGLFTDGLMTQVVPEYASLQQLSALEAEIVNHPSRAELQESIDLAKKIVRNELDVTGTIITAEQVGNRKGFAKSELRTDLGSGFQPTGLAVKANKEITVYVDADPNTPLPTLMFAQSDGAWSNWSRSVSLSVGKNVIKVPEVPKDNKYHHDVTKGGPIYIVNPYTEDQQGKTPRIRIEGADRIPYMTKTTDPEQFKAFLKEYVERVEADKKKNPDVTKREVLDVVEIVSDHVIYTGTATAAYKAYITQEKDPVDTIKGYDAWMHQIFEVNGLDGRSITHDPSTIRESIRLMQPWGYMYAAGDHTGIQSGSEAMMFNDFRVSSPGWGLNHEIGHRIDIAEREFLEVTNNMTSMLMSVLANNMDNRIAYDRIYTYVTEENKVNLGKLGYFDKLAAYWQLELAYPGYWAELESLYREKKVSAGSDLQKQQYLVEFSSEAVGKNLSSHFARHGFTVTEETKAKVSVYPEPQKVWYLNNTVHGYKGEGFTKAAALESAAVHDKSKGETTIRFSINEAGKADLLGYEVLRDGEVIAFTRQNVFVDKGIGANNDHEYEVIAYDKKLNPLKSGVITEDSKVAVSNINEIVQTIKSVLASNPELLKDMKSVSIAQPEGTILVGHGNEAEEKIKALVGAQLQGIDGTYILTFRNPGSASVEEIAKNNTFIQYQFDTEGGFYRYSQGNVVNKGEVVGAIDTSVVSTPKTLGKNAIAPETLQQTEEAQVQEKIDIIRAAVKTALTSEGVDITGLSDIYLFNPKIEGYVGTEMSMKVLSLLEKELAGKVDGKYSIHIQDSDTTSVEELLEHHLVITYQLESGGNYYIHSDNGLEIW